jgi:DNA-directed RNA polymerase specialized sigma24 family protein
MTETRRQLAQVDSNFDPCEVGVALEALLQDVLACLRRHRDTPLQEVDEGPPLSGATLRALALKHFPQEWESHLGAVGLRSALNQLIDQVLNDGQSATAGECSWAPLIPADGMPQAASVTGEEIETALRAWIEGLWTALREVHPRAIEIVALRHDGFQERDIGERLALPLRLVHRIVRDVRTAWQRRES